MEMREKILTFIEKNSRVDLKELAIMLGVDESTVANEMAAMEQEHIICGYRPRGAGGLTALQNGFTITRKSTPYT